MTLTRSSQQIIAFLLLVILLGNFLLSVFWHQWRVSLLWHDHIILGPLYPGWEDHHGHNHSQQRSETPPIEKQLASSEDNTGVSTKIISVYQSLVGDGTILSFGIQIRWLTEWPTLSEISSIVWLLGMTPLAVASAFLPPPDKPPSPSLQ